MKTQMAAYGINLVAANRIFLVDPLWDKAKEAQAIKRAHRYCESLQHLKTSLVLTVYFRIGQVRPVKVEKLIIAGSYEELVLKVQSDESLAGFVIFTSSKCAIHPQHR
jgi:SNF2 family DNA or RNA helicase